MMSAPSITTSELLPITLLLRDLDALRTVCRRRGWDFRAGQTRYRWSGGWLGELLTNGVVPKGLGRCAHAIGVPGCRYEIGLLDRGGHCLPVWDDTPEGGLDVALGLNGAALWQAYVTEKVRQEARQRRHAVSRHRDALGALHLGIVDKACTDKAHLQVSRDAACSLRTFNGSDRFHYLADALGTPRIQEMIVDQVLLPSPLGGAPWVTGLGVRGFSEQMSPPHP